jgi:hypothetical protein
MASSQASKDHIFLVDCLGGCLLYYHRTFEKLRVRANRRRSFLCDRASFDEQEGIFPLFFSKYWCDDVFVCIWSLSGEVCVWWMLHCTALHHNNVLYTFNCGGFLALVGEMKELVLMLVLMDEVMIA